MGAGEGRVGVPRLPQEQRLQDVAGAAVSLEHGAVQQVLSVVCLVVQCHCNIYFNISNIYNTEGEEKPLNIVPF